MATRFRKQAWVLLEGAVLALPRAHASSIESETSLGNQTQIESLEYEGDTQTPGESTTLHRGLNWDFSFTATRSVDDSTPVSARTTSSLVDASSELTGEVGWEGQGPWDLGAGGAFSITPAESLHGLGPLAYLGYVIEWGEASLELKGRGEWNRYSTSPLLGKVRRRAAASTAAGTLDQSGGELEATFQLPGTLKASLSYTKYVYAQDVSAFLQGLDSTRAVRINAGSGATGLSGFASDMFDLSVKIYPVEGWEIEPEAVLSRSAIDATWGTSLRLKAARELTESWKAGVGAERDDSLSDGTEYLGIVTVGYEF